MDQFKKNEPYDRDKRPREFPGVGQERPSKQDPSKEQRDEPLGDRKPGRGTGTDKDLGRGEGDRSERPGRPAPDGDRGLRKDSGTRRDSGTHRNSGSDF